MTTSLYERIGGDSALTAAVNAFYQKVIADDQINGFFADVDITKQMRKMKSFLSYAFGASTPFTGKSMRDAHARLVQEGLNDTHFDRVKQHLYATLQELRVDDDLIEEVINITESTRSDVLNK